ncbi:MAG: ABC transporter ATP-binding protein [Candidatus Hydrogenedentota bacterium]
MYTPLHKGVPGRPFLSLLRYNSPYAGRYLGGATLALVSSAIGLAMPLVIGAIVDGFTAGAMTQRMLVFYFFLMVGIAAVSGFMRYWQRMLMIGASRIFEYDLRNDYFRHIQTLSRSFFNRTKTGDIMARAVNDLNYVREFIGPGIMGTVDIVKIPMTLAVMVYLSASLSLWVLLPLPLVSLCVYGFMSYSHRQSTKVQDQFGVISSRAQENLAGARVVMAYGVAGVELAAFERDSRVYMRESVKLAVVMSLVWPIIGFVVGGVLVIVLWRGGTMVIDQEPVSRLMWNGGNVGIQSKPFSVGDLFGFVTCLSILGWPLAQFGWVLTLYQRGAAAMNRILDVLKEEPEIRDSTVTRGHVQSVKGAIRFENVSFAYNGRVVLSDIDFRVEPGQTLAIVGPTGSGKSTLIALLTRELEPASGRVLVDDMDVREVPLLALRGSMGFVPQDGFLFSATIRENIAFGKPEASEAALDRASELAQFSETVEGLPQRYETLLGERGVNLSGGQKQRLTIARAVIRDPNVLILDDALSSVDAHTEEEILVRLKEFMATRTSVIISHRISAVRHADLILVIDDGRIVQRGRHSTLLAEGGLYAEMYERQLLEDELEEQA